MKKHFNLIFTLFTVISLLTVFFISCDSEESDNSIFDIRSSYEGLDWSIQFKAANHAHSTNSDGSASLSDAIETHYAQGYDILGMTDHVWKRPSGAGEGSELYKDLVNKTWTATKWKDIDITHITEERFKEIQEGKGRNDRGMLMIPHSAEWAYTDAEETNVFFHKMNEEVPAATPAWSKNIRMGIIDAVAGGGVFFINHPGRTTAAMGFRQDGADDPKNPSNMSTWIRKFANLYMEFPITSLTGMEIFNREDQDSRHDRILWDNVLKLTIPEGRFIWGYGNDDSHSTGGIGINYNMFLMPSNTLENFRNAMVKGHSYMVTCMARNEGVDNPRNSQNRPHVTSVSVDNYADTITIIATNATKIVWISEGRIILETEGLSSTIELMKEDIVENVGSYVRANIIGPTGMAAIQPIGTKRR